jgi:predicted  nucleic acid-binding Zn-ribbon protein
MEELRSLEDLLDLQRVDSDIDRLLERRQSLPELEAFRAAHEDMTRREQDLELARAELKTTELALDKAQGELELGEEKLAREENRLFAGGLGARDVEHLRREVEMLRRQKGEGEDLVLGLMEQRETQAEAIPPRERELEDVRTRRSELEAAIAEQWKVIDAEIAIKEQRKAAIVTLIDEDLLALYDRLRSHLDGVAVGRLAEGICGGCHLKLSAAEQNAALHQDPPRCVHCDRILVPQ